MADAVLDDLRAGLPDGAVLDDPDVVASYARDQAMFAPSEQPRCVVFAADTEQVRHVVRVAARHQVPVVPRGAGSGLAGSSNGVTGGITLVLTRMNKIVEIDPANRLAVVEPGVVNLDLRKALEPHELFYPPDPSSYDWCTIGGNLSTNAGGLCCVKYGVTTDFVLGLEVVLASGEVLRTGRRTVKGVAGYDLARLFVGAEGTLGVITQATLALRPLPAAPVTLVATFGSTAAAGRAVSEVVLTGLVPSLLEIMDQTCIRAVEEWKNMGLDRDAHTLLLGQSDAGGSRGADEIAQVAALCRAAGADEVYSTEDLEEGRMLLAARRLALPALERYGATLIDDVAVPRSRIADLLDGTAKISAECDVLIGVVGHAGDGNMHPTVIFDAADAAAKARAYDAFNRILDLGLALGGTVTGEHGIGTLKLDWLAREIGPVALGVHASIKQALDPLGILNPGKVFAQPG
ncbi:MAG TPA: FAD-linked oxidase C-terminal domain-containing protein [Mycobacteriales bacterium]|nr:FAD-linked oxidase C-terminal domain-containing protein [Mycobacteriales bacterium]